jgi:CRISPR system Cascade subunit CasA
MPSVRYDLLREPLLSAVGASGVERVSLPALLARLSAGTPTEFAALQAHQVHAWHAFLVQLGALALQRAGRNDVPAEPSAWAELLLALGGGGPEPWSLVVDDLRKPAFLQPPVPEGSLEGWAPVPRPDELDVLITAKNFDVKMSRMAAPSPEHWAYALVSMQTMEGYSGSLNYGICRMNGGMANRPGLSAAAADSAAARFRRDVRAWLEARAKLVDTHQYPAEGGAALLWLDPWDGTKPIALHACDPFFIEICRRVRLVGGGEVPVAALTQTTQAARVEADEAKGHTGDVWTPVAIKEGKALTVSAEGFSYRRLAEYMFGPDWQRGAAFDPRPDDGPTPVIVARALVRGQGKTEGYHERVVPIRAGARRFFATLEGRERLWSLARTRIELIATLRLKVLNPALLTLAQGAPEKLELDDRRMDRYLDALDAAVDREFFGHLFADIDVPTDAAQAAFKTWALEQAKALLDEAVDATPLPSARRYRVIAKAEAVFGASAYKQGFVAPRAPDEAHHERSPTT